MWTIQTIQKTEDLISFNQLSGVLNVYTKYPELGESFLIKSRIGIAISNNNVICPFHRAKFGKEWRSSRLCVYPDHQIKSNSDLRALTKGKSNTLSTWYPNKAFPFGALICTKHRKELAKAIIHSHSSPIEDPITANEYNSDDNYVPDVFETTPQDWEILDNLSLVLENSPIKFQVTKCVEELQPSTLRYLRKKLNKKQKQSVNKLMEHVAPGQGNLFKKMLFPEKNAAIDVPPEIEKLSHAFVSSSSNNEKCPILSLVSNSYSKTEIMKLFNCSRYLLDKAKKASYFQQINQSDFTKSKLDCEKA